MQNSKNISITLPPRMLREAEKAARREGRTKSELFREALRHYLMGRQFRMSLTGTGPQNSDFSELAGLLASPVRLSDRQLKEARAAFAKNWARHE